MRLYRSTANSCDAYYEDYRKLREGGGKMTYIAAVLAEKYGVCERQVYLIIARFEKDCTDISV